MPLPPLPENNTDRMYFDYDTGGFRHTVAVRFNADQTTRSNVQERFADFLTSIASGLVNTWSIYQVRYQLAGTVVSLPDSLNASIASFAGTGGATIPARLEAREIRWIGRSPFSGRKVSLSIFGAVGENPNNGRYILGTGPFATQFTFDALELDPEVFVTIDGTPASWYRYANSQYNSYWETELRG